jgi:hypothetical protein
VPAPASSPFDGELAAPATVAGIVRGLTEAIARELRAELSRRLAGEDARFAIERLGPGPNDTELLVRPPSGPSGGAGTFDTIEFSLRPGEASGELAARIERELRPRLGPSAEARRRTGSAGAWCDPA